MLVCQIDAAQAFFQLAFAYMDGDHSKLVVCVNDTSAVNAHHNLICSLMTSVSALQSAIFWLSKRGKDVPCWFLWPILCYGVDFKQTWNDKARARADY